ncbi:MAG: histidine--tRNA ligase [Candidatus Omnitrophica bacterium]|nr:histidine--tRNA ligase [Candidatus Omnitrophota bacterium]
MTKQFSVPRGTNDILPENIFAWRSLEDSVRKLVHLYGYQEIRTPIFEETELFARSMGQTSDVVQKQMLQLAAQPKPEETGVVLSGLALRPEATAAVVRAYIENSLDKKEPLSKLFYIGPMFRGERPQKGRLRQFHQVGVEALGPGSASPYLDAEVIALAVHLLEALGVEGFQLKINNLGSLDDKKNLSKWLREKLGGRLSDLCSDCQDRFERNVFRILDCKNPTCREVIAKTNLNYQECFSKESVEYFSKTKEALSALGISYQESMQLVRGLDYYTNTVFEITAPSLGSQDALGAGGRYNHLVEELGGAKVDAIGFALGIERILLALGETKKVLAQPMDAFLVVLAPTLLSKAFQLVNELRQSGVSVDMSYHPGSLKSQMRMANKQGARFVILLGEDEDRKGVVAVKNMETGEQKEVNIKNNLEELIALLNGEK